MTDPEYTIDIEELVNRITAFNNITSYTTSTITKIGTGQGFYSKIFALTINDRACCKKLNIVLKLAYKGNRTTSPIALYYKNEIYFYAIVFPALQNFLKSIGIEEEYELLPRCYLTRLVLEKESVILGNLETELFQLYTKDLNLPVDHFELIFERYGYFHALSIALKDHDFEKYSEAIARLKNVFQDKLHYKKFLDQANSVCARVKKLLRWGKDREIINGFQKYLDNLEVVLAEFLGDGGDFSAILHGDCWTKNVLFQYDVNTGKPIDVRFIDFQLSRVGNPICDLSSFLYTDSTKTNLDKLYQFLRIYHESLSSNLEKFGIDPQKIISYKDLKEQWRVYSRFGFIVGLMVIRSKCTEAKEVTDLDRYTSDIAETMLSIKYDNKTFERKVRDLLCHMVYIEAL